MAIKDKRNSSLNLQITSQQLRCFLELGACLQSFSISAEHFLHAQTNHRDVQKKAVPVSFKRMKPYLCWRRRSRSSCAMEVRSVFPWKRAPPASQPPPSNPPGEPELPASAGSVRVMAKLASAQRNNSYNRQKWINWVLLRSGFKHRLSCHSSLNTFQLSAVHTA